MLFIDYRRFHKVFFSLDLLFLIRLRFLLDNSLAYILRSRYGNLVVKELRKWKLDLTFLIACLHNNITQKFFNFRVNNPFLKPSRVSHACQMKLLKEEISLKKIKNQNIGERFQQQKRKT